MLDFKLLSSRVYYRTAKTGDDANYGWPETDHCTTSVVFSKIAVNAMSRIKHRPQFQQDSHEDLIVNHVHPGNDGSVLFFVFKLAQLIH